MTISTAQLTKAGTDALIAARALTIGIFANTIVKVIIALTLGRGVYRVFVAIGLTLVAIALGGAVWFWR